MAYDTFTIQSLARELRAPLIGAPLKRAPCGPDGLYLSAGGPGLWFGVASPGLLALTEPPAGWEAAPAHELERYLSGARVLEVNADPAERAVHLRLERPGRRGEATHARLVLEMIPSRWASALVAERSGRVLALGPGASGRRGLQAGQPYVAPRGRPRLLPGRDAVGDFIARARGESGPVARLLCRALAGADEHVAAEVVERAGIHPEAGKAAGDDELRQLWAAAEEVYDAPLSGQCFLWREAQGPAFSVLRPRREVGELTEHGSVSDAARLWRERWQAGAAQRRRRTRCQRALSRRQGLLARRAAALARDLEEAAGADELERRGSVLLSHLGAIRPGASQVRLPDTFDPSGEGEVVIDLDPGMPAADQAARWLKTARRLERRLDRIPPRQAQVAAELARLEAAAARVRAGGDLSPDEEGEWMREPTDSRRPRGAAAPGEPVAHPRRYRTSSGWLVLAGRNNTENDILTHRVAAQEDIWFHASGYSGSHVVLRREGRREEPGNRTLEEAAGVAAYWSKGRTARKVPVIYTRAKHVSKPRGGPPGLATVRREKTLMVAPALLPQEDEVPRQNEATSQGSAP